ncbi:unnamed protein product [Somion occarium]|uniref:Protein phosphatase n=2 Tax=Somion occarium TaxID=3059160 RepID=A0ABP1DA92_9APHY
MPPAHVMKLHSLNVSKTILSKQTFSSKNARLRYLSTSALPRPFRFHVGASWAGKQPDTQQRRVKTLPFPKDSEIGAWRDQTLSRPKASSSGRHIGEDFFYVQDMRKQSGVSLGIADGVGGWVDAGVDPSLFSQALMYHAHRYAKVSWPGEPETDPNLDYEEREQVDGWELTPQECMELAHGQVLREHFVKAGSSTACIVNLNAANGILRSANLGDSGFCIIRSSNVIYNQAPQTHFFNCPKQLTKLPSTGFTRGLHDTAQDADLYETNVVDGDIIVLYTDGFSDNVFPSETAAICSLISRQFTPPPAPKELDADAEDPPEEDAQVQVMADRLVDYAQMCMVNKKRVSPFERAAAREGLFYRGGKMDDVTVVVALVCETQ